MAFPDRGGGCGNLFAGNRGRAVQAEAASLEDGGKRRDDTGIEFGAGQRVDDADHVIGLHSGLIRTVRSHGIKGIGHHDDAWHQRHLLTLETVGIPAAVKRLVVQLNAGDHLAQLLYRTQDAGALAGVGLHDFELIGRERARFFEDAVLNSDLAHIVELRGDAYLLDFFRDQGELCRQNDGVARYPVRVAASVWILLVDRACEHLYGAHEERAVFLGGALQIEYQALQVVTHQVEGIGEFADFSAAVQTHALRKVTFSDGAARLRQDLHRSADMACRRNADQHADAHRQNRQPLRGALHLEDALVCLALRLL